jgi:NADPH-dependent 2,4-dienoyl-CoA reductase/sulfur reductase-like enzyme
MCGPLTTAPGTTVVVGAGLAGSRLALALRAAAPDERVVLVGDEPHCAYERPPLSKEFLLGARSSGDLALAGAGCEHLDRAGVEHRVGARVTRLADDAVTLADGSQLPFDRLVLATGARPRTLDLPEVDANRVHVLRSLDDASRLRTALVPGSRLVVVGSGFVGAEVASSARTLGVDVTLVEAEEVPFARTLGAEVGTWLARRWHAHGVDLHTGDGVVGATMGAPGPVLVELCSGATIAADHVLLAIGTVANDDLFHHAWPGHGAPGLGIPVDAVGRTPVARVFAVGDVALGAAAAPGSARRRVEHWTDAAASAQRLARTLALGDHAAGPPPVPYAWSDQFGARVQVAGRVEPGLRPSVEESTLDSLLVRYHDEHGDLRAIAAVGRADAVARYRSGRAA